jgi:hypothetical protein
MADSERTEEKRVFSGQILLYRRKFKGKESPNWRARIRVPSSQGHLDFSTRTRYAAEAERIAIEKFREAEGRTQQGLPLRPIAFERAAREYIEWKQGQAQVGRCSQTVFKYHKSIVENALTPFFGAMFLHKLRAVDVERFQEERRKKGIKGGGQVRPATINRDNAVLRAVLKFALRQEYIRSMPTIENVSAFARRPSFTTEEAEQLKVKLDEWVSSPHQFDGPHVQDYRRLFRLYCLVIYFAGIRPGKEMASLRWEDLEHIKDGSASYVLLKVKTAKQKDGQLTFRPVIGLDELWKAFEELEGSHLKKEFGYIFAHPRTTQLDPSFIGLPIASFKTQWNHFIRWADMEHEPSPPHRRRTLYSLRHLYFEQRLIHSDVRLHELAVNGGSSPEVIARWYHHATAKEYAPSLSKVIARVNKEE